MLFTKVFSVYLYNDNTILTLGDFSFKTSIAKIVLVSTFMSKWPFKKYDSLSFVFFLSFASNVWFLKIYLHCNLPFGHV